MGDNLDLTIWRLVKVDGSTSNELVADVAAERLALGRPAYERSVILDAIEDVSAEGDIVYRDGRWYRKMVDDASWTRIEERLNKAWPSRGGRVEIIRALADEVKEMIREEEERWRRHLN